MQTLTIQRTTSSAPPGERQTAVHPGWLAASAGLVDDAMDQRTAESARFCAFAQLMRTAGALDRAATDILGSLGITAGAFFALLELEMVGSDGIAPSELARRLAVARRTATLYVDILVKQGWASREAHPADKRMILARLTQEGFDLLAEVATRHKAQLARLLDTLNAAEASRLQELLSLIPLEPDTLDCAFLSPFDEDQD
jgi:DNA-binding MarR family transcriptional regulator